MSEALRSNPESTEKMEMLERGEQLSEVLKSYDNEVVSAETKEHINAAQAELYSIMMNPHVTWSDCQTYKLPWDPRFELHKQQMLAANDNRAEVAEAA